jgi:hypothetical protein
MGISLADHRLSVAFRTPGRRGRDLTKLRTPTAPQIKQGAEMALVRVSVGTRILIGLLSTLPLQVAVAQAQSTGTATSSNTNDLSLWDMSQYSQRMAWLLAIAAVLVVGMALLLYFAAQKPSDPYIYKLRASFFFWLGMGYTLFLLLLAVAYNVSYQGRQPYLIGDILPIGVPWFGAIGAVTISLEGVFRWNQRQWNADYNYWHIGRPLFGAVLGIVAFFLFVLLLSSSGTSPKFLADPPQASLPKDFILYYVVAFLVGYREETFRELIRRVTDMILKPAGSQGVDSPQVTFKNNGVAVSEIEFHTTTSGAHSRRTVEVQNTGGTPLVTPTVTVQAADLLSEGAFGTLNDHVTGMRGLEPNQIKTVDVTFSPRRAGHYAGILTIEAQNLATRATILISGSA